MAYVQTKFGENRPTCSRAEITCARTPQRGDGQTLRFFLFTRRKTGNQAVSCQRKTKVSTLHSTTGYLFIIIIVIIIILVITRMQGIYNYMPETNHVSTVYSVAAVLYLHFVLHVMLFHP
jgi:hypothetical protein